MREVGRRGGKETDARALVLHRQRAHETVAHGFVLRAKARPVS